MYDNNETQEYTYLFVRTDMPLANQLVQSCHAAQEAGHKFHYPENKSSYLILFQVPNETELMATVNTAIEAGVQMHTFFEPDFPYGYTAACSEPIKGEKRRVFEKCKLWR